MSRKVFFITSTAALLVAFSAFILLSLNNTQVSSPNMQTTEQNEQKNKISKEAEYNLSVTFARQMVIYNQQAIDISELFLSKNSPDVEVNDVAATSLKYHRESVDNYVQWLEREKQSYLNLSEFEKVDAHDGYPTNPGMPSVVTLNNFEKASINKSRKSFLDLQRTLHEGAIAQTNSSTENIHNETLVDLIRSDKIHYPASITAVTNLLNEE